MNKFMIVSAPFLLCAYMFAVPVAWFILEFAKKWDEGNWIEEKDIGYNA